MGNVIITRKGGGAVLDRAPQPTVNVLEVSANSITFEFTNPDQDNELFVIYAVEELVEPGGDGIEIVVLDAGQVGAGATSAPVTIEDLDPDTTYTGFAVGGQFGKEFSEVYEETFTTESVVILGVEWNQTTDTVTRLDDAVGLTAGSDFDEFNPYKLKRCMINDDLSINYYIDPTDPTKIGEVVNTGSYTTGNNADYTGGHGQVMVEMPKFLWKYDEPTSKQYQWRITDIAQSGYSVHPAFVTDGVEKDFIYMSAFEGSASSSTGTLRSVSGVALLNDRTIAQFRSQAQARGTGWQLQNYWTNHALQILYLIEYADFDSQTTIGRGVVDTSTRANSGDTISLGNASGAASGTDGEVSISYRGVENLWGNIFKWIDGINMNSSEVFVANENFESGKYDGDYTSIGNIIGSSTFTIGFTSDIIFPHFLATERNGSSTSHLHDTFASGFSQGDICRNGGIQQDNSGIFLLETSSDINADFASTSTRIQIL